MKDFNILQMLYIIYFLCRYRFYRIYVVKLYLNHFLFYIIKFHNYKSAQKQMKIPQHPIQLLFY